MISFRIFTSFISSLAIYEIKSDEMVAFAVVLLRYWFLHPLLGVFRYIQRFSFSFFNHSVKKNSFLHVDYDVILTPYSNLFFGSSTLAHLVHIQDIFSFHCPYTGHQTLISSRWTISTVHVSGKSVSIKLKHGIGTVISRTGTIFWTPVLDLQNKDSFHFPYTRYQSSCRLDGQ